MDSSIHRRAPIRVGGCVFPLRNPERVPHLPRRAPASEARLRPRAALPDHPTRSADRVGAPVVLKYISTFRSGSRPSCAPVKTGMVEGMKESNDEGIATHIGPAPCADSREGEGEASAGVRAGQVLSRENRVVLRDADAVGGCGRRHLARRYRETRGSPARSQTLRTLEITMQGNREIPGLPAATGTAGRVGKPKGEIRR